MSVTNSHYAYLDHDYGMIPFKSNSEIASKRAEEATIEREDPAKDTDLAKTANQDSSFFGDDGFGFDDFLDIINPLQHIPVISTLYREITGDEISPGSRIMGGGIFGGGIGLAASVVNTAIESETGKDIGGHLVAMVTGDEGGDTNQDIASKTVASGTAPQTIVDTAEQALPAAGKVADIPTQAELQASMAKDMPAAAGLQWKGPVPELHQNILQASATQGKSFSQDQLSEILGSFRTNKVNTGSLPKIEAAASSNSAAIETDTKQVNTPIHNEAIGTYEKQATAAEMRDRLVSDSFDYLDRII